MKNKKLMIFFVLILSLLVVVGCWKSKNEPVETENGDTGQEVENIKTEYNSLTGEYVEELINPTAVIVDNLSPARPQTGLIDADVVYELEMEGRITRLIALYHGDPPEHVGPVRSARSYSMAIVKEWDAYYVHVGGSNEAFRLVDEWNMRDICSIRGHRGFWTDNTRFRPHNTYIELEKALENKEDNGVFKDWNFVEDYGDLPDYREFSMRYSSSNNIKYVWNEEDSNYKRYLNNQRHIDRMSGEQIEVNNVIVQYAEHTHVGNELGHIDVKVIGKGDAEYFFGGRHMEGTWEKSSYSSPTRYYDDGGNEIEPVKGKTWIQVVRPGSAINKIDSSE